MQMGTPPPKTYFEAERHIPIKPVLAAMGLVIWVLTLLLENHIGYLTLALGIVSHLVLTGFAWALDSKHPRLSRWYAVSTSLMAVLMLSVHPDIPSALLLMSLPTVLAAALMGTQASLLTAGIGTLLIIVMTWHGATMPLSSWIAIVATWAAFALMADVYNRVTWLYQWLGDSFERMHRLLEESRDQKAQLAQALDDLQHASRQMMLAHDRTAAFRELAERAQQSKGDFVARVSHEFRTPLNMIIGLVDLMVESPELYSADLPATLSQDLAIVHRNSAHLASMVNDILDLSRLESGYMTLSKSAVDLTEMITKAIAVVRPLVDKKGLSMKLQIPDDVGDLVCDPVRIRQVILNLISNAARFTEVGGLVIDVDPKPTSIVVSVADTGPGIQPGSAERIFEPFQQAADQSSAKNGTGLGLSLSKQFVELHGGRLWLETEVGKGSIFSFELPRAGATTPTARPGHWIQEGWEWMVRRVQLDLPDAAAIPRIISFDQTGSLTPTLMRHTDQIEFLDAPTLDHARDMLQECPAHALIVNAATKAEMRRQVLAARQIATDIPVIGCIIPPRKQRALAAGAVDYLIKPIVRQDLRHLLATYGDAVKRMLLVDDDAELLDLIQRMLTTIDASIEVRKAVSGLEGLNALQAEPIDLVLLDVRMPEMDGWAFLEARNQDAALADIPVVLITAEDPTDRPLVSPELVLTAQDGIALGHLLQTSLAFSSILTTPSLPQLPAPR